jgi:hypothetical protein
MSGLYRRFVPLLVLAASVLTSVAMSGCAARVHVNTLYDPTHGDWHRWDDDERRAYRQYWQETHEPFRTYGALSQQDVNDYWSWRHGRPNADRARSAKE